MLDLKLLEIIFDGLVECILYGCLYWIGYLILWVASFGQLRIAPFSTYGDENWKSKWYHVDWSIWLKRSGHAKALKAEMVCLTGLAVVMVALLVFAAVRHTTPSGPAAPTPETPASAKASLS